MTEHLFRDINFKRSFFPGESQTDTFDSLIAAMGGIDIQILGIGTNGHIGFKQMMINDKRAIDLSNYNHYLHHKYLHHVTKMLNRISLV